VTVINTLCRTTLFLRHRFVPLLSITKYTVAYSKTLKPHSHFERGFFCVAAKLYNGYIRSVTKQGDIVDEEDA
jgi:hypothetical protein